jgi:hypothetical protein
MKLAACYTVFDGAELLEASMKAIESQVDFFVICWQHKSNNGNRIKASDLAKVHRLRGDNIIIVQYEPNIGNAKQKERDKHNKMIQVAREYGATHFLMAACDHFYLDYEFEFAKRLCEVMDWDATFTAMYTYYKDPTWQLTPIETYFMPFICKLYPETRIERIPRFPLLVDPSVQMNTWIKYYLFKEFEIMLHHYSMIRKDIEGKFKNAASPWRPAQVAEFTQEWNGYDINGNPGVKYFQGRKIKVVNDYFNLGTIL